MWPSKPEVLISPTVWQHGSAISANLGFSTTPSATKLTPCDATTTDNWKLQYGRFARQSRNFWQSVDVAMIWLIIHLLSLTSSKIRNLAWELSRYLSQFQRCNCFRFWGPYRHFRLSVTVVLTHQHYFAPVHGLIPQCRWNFNCTVRSLRDISISGFGRHFLL